MDENVLGVAMWVVFIFGLLAMLVCVIDYFSGVKPLVDYATAGAEGTIALFLTSVISRFRRKVR